MIEEWVREIITGTGGLHDFEKYELATPNIPRDEATAIWVIRCLGNPACEGSQEVIDEIVRHRNEERKLPDPIKSLCDATRKSHKLVTEILNGFDDATKKNKSIHATLDFVLQNPDSKCFCIEWFVDGFGFGRFVFDFKNRDGQLKIENECMSKDFIKAVLGAMVDGAELENEKESDKCLIKLTN